MKHRFVVTRLQIFSLSIWPFIERNSAKHRYKQSLLQREPEGKVIPAAIYHLELPLVKVCSEDQEYRLEFVRYAESQHHHPIASCFRLLNQNLILISGDSYAHKGLRSNDTRVGPMWLWGWIYFILPNLLNTWGLNIIKSTDLLYLLQSITVLSLSAS